MSFGGWRAWRIKIMSRIMSRSWQQKVSVYGQPQAEHIHITSTRSTTPCMRWRATKPAMARPSRGCSSVISASKKFRYCLKNEGCILKEVQPSFRVEWYKSCTLSFKLREKRGENSPKWYIEEVVHISWLHYSMKLVNKSRMYELSLK